MTVTATRIERDPLDLPVSIDVVGGRTIREDRPQVNLSEALNAVPGIVVQNRYNYAQDLQISSRGFGARASFGVRGIRLIADGIPATMPDGQGQAATFNLDTAERIEVLRGPFSSMYGNSSGGVIQIFTADAPRDPTVTTSYYRGTFDTTKTNTQYGAQHGPLNANVAYSLFETGGFRDHSAARREHGHAKLKFDGGSAGTLTVLADALHQPDTQDPLGLTRAQVQQDRRQAGTNALAFNTRKSVAQSQVGLVHDLKLTSHDTLQTRFYVGDRQVTQYLGIPIATQAAPTHSGGVVDLDRGYWGGGLRWSRSNTLLGGPFDVHVGADYERMAEGRRGYINSFGNQGNLKRDEHDTVYTADFYLQSEWRFHERWLLMAGVRRSNVHFNSRDFFVTAANGDDSGGIDFSKTLPVAGVTFDVAPRVKLYANLGKGFETPTFAELAYRPDGTTGLNFALRPSVSTNREIGSKFELTPTSRATVALFRIDVADEIVVASNTGGRTTFKNAAHTRREGVELGLQGRWLDQFEASVAYTRIRARFTDAFTTSTGTPATIVTVNPGSRLPGVPQSTLYGELVWRHARSGFHAAAEVRHNGSVYVDDQNSDAASSYTIGNVRFGFEQQGRGWRLSEFVRVDNVTNREYVGSVIVAEANGRFFEPAPGRTWLVGVSASLTFR
ncbi:MAG TPA: TonB-dependent receptor [Gammaproteobacteria bacterium]|nr:TonB-dependent receptor [Gammaproteobacteria bacterium]